MLRKKRRHPREKEEEKIENDRFVREGAPSLGKYSTGMARINFKMYSHGIIALERMTKMKNLKETEACLSLFSAI